MLIDALVVGVALWLLGFVVFPIGFWVEELDANGKNWPGVFVVKRGLDCPQAVWAQEKHEAGWRYRTLPLTLIPFAVGRMVPKLAYVERSMELMGHEVEVQAERRYKGQTKQYEEAAREREAKALVDHYKAFEGYTQQEVYDLMLLRKNRARKWVDRNIFD